MTNAAMDGSAQDFINAGTNASSTIANVYDPATGATINNAGGMFANSAGQFQNGNYAQGISQAGGGIGTAIGGNTGQDIQLGSQTGG